MTSADYEELISALTNANVAITDNGEFRSTYDILSDIADVWDELSSMDQAAIAESLSGTRQQAVFYSIIEQFQEASGAMDSMAESAGTLSDSYDTYLESTTAHIQSFKTAMATLGSDLFQSEALQAFIDLGTSALNMVDGLVESVGSFATVLGGAGLAATIKSLV